MPYTPILATLGYVFSPDRSRVLMVHRQGRPGDLHEGKYNGLGGKLESGESIIGGMIRELQEEAGITATKLHLAGTISWPGFGKNGDDWFGFLFRITEFTGSVNLRSPEGPLEWVEIDRVAALPLWDGDRQFLPLVFDPDRIDNRQVFHGNMPYQNGQMQSWSVDFDSIEK
jgi:8-oxo-dGTP diphosphatase